MDNEMKLILQAKSENEALARIALSGFIATIDPQIHELAEFKTILSEAVTNAIIHGYEGNEKGKVEITALREGHHVFVEVKDEGQGIENITLAKEPLYSSKSHEDRSGMGFTIMESFSTTFSVESIIGKGTVIKFSKHFQPSPTCIVGVNEK